VVFFIDLYGGMQSHRAVESAVTNPNSDDEHPHVVSLVQYARLVKKSQGAYIPLCDPFGHFWI
jgi:hypothetical protein